ncbi:P4H3 [Scenedesmus sp. PABB004]|nr:P4H3 [Scenedesmus sp. PABB004]
MPGAAATGAARPRRCAAGRAAPAPLLAAVAAAALVCAAAADAVGQVDDRLIGWLGETHVKRGGAAAAGAGRSDARGLRVLSWEPRIMHYRKFLTDEECDYIIAQARPRLRRSDVADSMTGRQKVSTVRTSSGMFFERGGDPVVRRVEERVAMVTMLPAGHAEGMQVLHYAVGQTYEPHHDYFSFEGRDANGGNRLATVLMYLAAPTSGGETVFPRVPRAPEQTLENGWSNCSLQGLAVRPAKGDATIFWSIRPDGTFDPASLHGSCAVIAGDKWSATKWIHVAHFATAGEAPKEVKRVIYAPPPPPLPAWCRDDNVGCAMWAESGECEHNPGSAAAARAAAMASRAPPTQAPRGPPRPELGLETLAGRQGAGRHATPSPQQQVLQLAHVLRERGQARRRARRAPEREAVVGRRRRAARGRGARAELGLQRRAPPGAAAPGSCCWWGPPSLGLLMVPVPARGADGGPAAGRVSRGPGGRPPPAPAPPPTCCARGRLRREEAELDGPARRPQRPRAGWCRRQRVRAARERGGGRGTAPGAVCPPMAMMDDEALLERLSGSDSDGAPLEPDQQAGGEGTAGSKKRVECQVVGCTVNVAAEGKAYCLKKRLCPEHMRAEAIVRKGYGDEQWRFCFQCGKLEPVSSFDGTKRSCRVRLQKRRQPPKRAATWGGGAFAKRHSGAAGGWADEAELAAMMMGGWGPDHPDAQQLLALQAMEQQLLLQEYAASAGWATAGEAAAALPMLGAVQRRVRAAPGRSTTMACLSSANGLAGAALPRWPGGGAAGLPQALVAVPCHSAPIPSFGPAGGAHAPRDVWMSAGGSPALSGAPSGASLGGGGGSGGALCAPRDDLDAALDQLLAGLGTGDAALLDLHISDAEMQAIMGGGLPAAPGGCAAAMPACAPHPALQAKLSAGASSASGATALPDDGLALGGSPGAPPRLAALTEHVGELQDLLERTRSLFANMHTYEPETAAGLVQQLKGAIQAKRAAAAAAVSAPAPAPAPAPPQQLQFQQQQQQPPPQQLLLQRRQAAALLLEQRLSAMTQPGGMLQPMACDMDEASVHVPPTPHAAGAAPARSESAAAAAGCPPGSSSQGGDSRGSNDADAAAGDAARRGKAPPMQCQVEGCASDLTAEGKAYCMKRRLCNEHMRADAVAVRDRQGQWRFCFQCGKLEPLARFEGLKRSCRVRLAQRKQRETRRCASDVGNAYGRGKAASRAGRAGRGADAGGGGGGLLADLQPELLPRVLGGVLEEGEEEEDDEAERYDLPTGAGRMLLAQATSFGALRPPVFRGASTGHQDMLSLLRQAQQAPHALDGHGHHHSTPLPTLALGGARGALAHRLSLGPAAAWSDACVSAPLPAVAVPCGAGPEAAALAEHLQRSGSLAALAAPSPCSGGASAPLPALSAAAQHAYGGLSGPLPSGVAAATRVAAGLGGMSAPLPLAGAASGGPHAVGCGLEASADLCMLLLDELLAECGAGGGAPPLLLGDDGPPADEALPYEDAELRGILESALESATGDAAPRALRAGDAWPASSSSSQAGGGPWPAAGAWGGALAAKREPGLDLQQRVGHAQARLEQVRLALRVADPAASACS